MFVLSDRLVPAFMTAAPLPRLDGSDESSVRLRECETPDIDELFREHAPAIASLGLAMLGRAEEADDLVQDVFLRAIKGIDGLRDPSRVREWLVTIAIRQGRTRLKRRQLSRLLLPKEEMDFDAIAGRNCSPEDRLQLARLFEVLESLSADQRVAWVLRYFQRETTQRVADQCGWSLRTTKRRLKKAHERVQQGMRA